jgi:SAM-dependent methyltransferase
MQKTRKDSIDCLIAMDFYEHLPKELLLDFLSEANRILKKGGCLVIRGPNGGSPFLGRALFNDITHFWCLTPIAFTSLFEMFGFKKTEYRDDTLASINKYRLFLVPLSWLAQQLVKKIIRLAIKEKIECLAPSFYICTWK